jgi:hypothetical protein
VLPIPVMSLPLLSLALHLIPFFLLVRIEEGPDLVVGRLMDVHHLRSPVLL